MRAVLALALTCAALSVNAQSLVGGRQCATPEPTITETLESMRVVRQFEARTAALRVQGAPPITVPVAFHVLSSGSGVSRGEIPTEWLVAQIDTLNSTFAPFGVRFAMSLVQRVENADWYEGLRLGSAQERQLKGELALDPARVLNVYTASPAGDFLGWATTPYSGSESDREDGVVLLDQSLPGGNEAPYNLGHTGTHEVGHWVGLLHTFSGGCTSPNDGVDDTPQERSGASGCPTTRDSCPLDAGLDPVHNYMDYSNDACMTEFTPGQITRSQALVASFRPTIATGGYGLATIPPAAVKESFVGVPAQTVLRVTNATTASFQVTSVESDNLDVSVSGLPVTVAPGDVAVLDVSVGVRSAGAFAESVRVSTTSAEAGELTVGLSGTAFLPPTARLTAESVEAIAIEGGGTAERTVTLANDGDGALTFNVDVDRLPEWVESVSPASGTIPPRGEVTLTFVLAAGELAPDAYSAPVVIVTNDPVRGDIAVQADLEVLIRPLALGLRPIYPNPTSGPVTIPLELPDEATVTVEVFDILGRRVAVPASAQTFPAGYPEVQWSSSALASGLYIVRARTDEEEATIQLIVAR